MAGIGFELRKAISDNAKTKKIHGYIGATFSSSGSMIIGIVLFCIIQFAAKMQKIDQSISDQFMCYVTTAMFISMIIVSVFSLVLSRYVSNMLYAGKTEKIMPSLIGGAVCVTVAGGLIFSFFMIASSLTATIFSSLLFLFFALNICWLLMTYISLLRDYKQVVIAFCTAFLIAIVLLIVICFLTELSVSAMILVLSAAFATVDIILFKSLYKQFSKQDNSLFEFFNEFKNNLSLIFVGLFLMIGMLGHFGIVWYLSSAGVSVAPFFRFSSRYDFPAIVAYFSTIPAAIYFITLFETAFSESYQKYFYVLGNGGSTDEVNNAKEKMLSSIHKGIHNIAVIQFVSCIFFITIGAEILSVLNIGMTENMLNSFRMFCVGYSLYYIGNTIMLIQLYFSNERRSVLTTSVFAIGTLLATYIETLYSGNTWGTGFAIVNIIFVVLAGIQLTRFVSDLEFNVLCRSTYSHNNITKSSNSSKANKNRLPYMLTAVCLAAVMVLSSGTLFIRDLYRQSAILTFNPEASTDILISPGMGFAPWADSDETLSMQTSLVYVELRWADWEPEDDFFDIEFVNNYYNLEYYKEDGRQVVFRFICDNPTEEKHIDIPQWLFELTEEDGDWYDIEYGKGFSPNYSNEIIISEHAEAIAALGECFGQDNFFVYVELGSLGHWGEWHIDYESGLTPMPAFETREAYIRPYLNAFLHSKFLIRYPLIDAQQYQMGLYNDMTGDYDETIYWLAQMAEGVWEQTGQNEQTNCSETWKTLPIGGEFASTHDNSYFMRDEFNLTIEGISASHQSFIGPKVIVDESDDNYGYQMEEILKLIGYRYRIDNVTVDFGNTESFEITCSMTNDGIAPIYSSYSIQLEILDDDGGIVWTTDDVDLDLRNVLPGENQSFSVQVDKDEFDDDMKYTFVVSVIDSRGIATIPLALADEMGANVYRIAEFYIK